MILFNNNNNDNFICIALVSSAQGALQSYKIIHYVKEFTNLQPYPALWYLNIAKIHTD